MTEPTEKPEGRDRVAERLERHYVELAHAELSAARERAVCGEHLLKAVSWERVAGKSRETISVILKQERGDG